LDAVLRILEAPDQVLVVDPRMRDEVVPHKFEILVECLVREGSVDDEDFFLLHELQLSPLIREKIRRRKRWVVTIGRIHWTSPFELSSS
jgi:hypothetical protein